jgi:hypothetical protein
MFYDKKVGKTVGPIATPTVGPIATPTVGVVGVNAGMTAEKVSEADSYVMF